MNKVWSLVGGWSAEPEPEFAVVRRARGPPTVGIPDEQQLLTSTLGRGPGETIAETPHQIKEADRANALSSRASPSRGDIDEADDFGDMGPDTEAVAAAAAVNQQRNTQVMDLLNEMVRTLGVPQITEARRTQQRHMKDGSTNTQEQKQDIDNRMIERCDIDGSRPEISIPHNLVPGYSSANVSLRPGSPRDTAVSLCVPGWQIVPSMRDEMLSLFESHTQQVNMRGSLGETLLHLCLIMIPDSGKDSETYKQCAQPPPRGDVTPASESFQIAIVAERGDRQIPRTGALLDREPHVHMGYQLPQVAAGTRRACLCQAVATEQSQRATVARVPARQHTRQPANP